MRNEIIGKVSVDLLSIPHLIFKVVRRKVMLNSLCELENDIKFPHIEVMALLRDEGMLNIKDICEKLMIAKAQMTYYIDTLVKYEFVERKTDSSDRRIFNISLTGKGITFYNMHEQKINKDVQEHMTVLTDQEVETLSESLTNLRVILQKLQ